MSEIVVAAAKPFESKEEYEAWVLECTGTEQQIKAGLRKGRQAMWETAEALHGFDGQSGWLALGYETLGEWLADPDITLSRRTYYRLVQAWQEMVVIREVPVPTLAQLDLTKVEIALPALKQGRATLEDVVSDVEVLGARDLRVKYRHEAEEDEYVPAPEGQVTVEEWPDTVDIEPRNDQTQTGTSAGEVEDEAEVQFVPVGVAQLLVTVLAQVMRELGAPERKAMSSKLRGECLIALETAYVEAGLIGDV